MNEGVRGLALAILRGRPDRDCARLSVSTRRSEGTVFCPVTGLALLPGYHRTPQQREQEPEAWETISTSLCPASRGMPPQIRGEMLGVGSQTWLPLSQGSARDPSACPEVQG